MTDLISKLPPRQKFLLGLTLSIGFIIWFCSATNIFSHDTINRFIFVYSFSIPFLLLGFSTIIDLNNNKVFIVWLIVGTLLLLISIITNHSVKFFISRNNPNSVLIDYSTSSLKTLFSFLVVYWLLNQLSKKMTGNFMVDTFRKFSWTSNEAGRKITGTDVICNIILYFTVICSLLF